MFIDEKHLMYSIAYEFVKNEEYDILYLNHQKEEVWLEKIIGKTSHVVRLLHKGFDWKNHLRKDIQHVFYNLNQMRRLLLGKSIIIHNVYVSEHTPIDSWEELKRPLQTKENKSQTMYVYYLSEYNHLQEELNRLTNNTGFEPVKKLIDPHDHEKLNPTEFIQYQLSNILEQKRNEFKDVLSYGKPKLTYFFILINIFLFFLLEANGGSTNIENLIRFGAKFNPYILLYGEWWRIFTSMFLHIGLLHLFMNMLALYYLGTVVERIYGSWRFLLIYLFAGIGGGLSSFAFSFNISAGASGAIFGLFGALLFFGVIHKKIFFQTMGRSLLTIIFINLVFGILVPQIDMGAHIGGLVAGFLISGALHLPKTKVKNRSFQFLMIAVYISLMIGLTIFGIKSSEEHMKNSLHSRDYLFNDTQMIKNDFDK